MDEISHWEPSVPKGVLPEWGCIGQEAVIAINPYTDHEKTAVPLTSNT